jgi:hypothetical protein
MIVEIPDVASFLFTDSLTARSPARGLRFRIDYMADAVPRMFGAATLIRRENAKVSAFVLGVRAYFSFLAWSKTRVEDGEA